MEQFVDVVSRMARGQHDRGAFDPLVAAAYAPDASVAQDQVRDPPAETENTAGIDDRLPDVADDVGSLSVPMCGWAS